MNCLNEAINQTEMSFHYAKFENVYQPYELEQPKKFIYFYFTYLFLSKYEFYCDFMDVFFKSILYE